MTLSEIQKENGWTDDETVVFAVEALGMDEAYAIFALAMENGELDGDVVVEGEEEDNA